MSSIYTIDASVFLNAYLPQEAGHAESARLLASLRAASAPIVVPTLLIPEVAAAIGRGQGDAELARIFVDGLRRIPSVFFVALDNSLADEAADIAAQNRLRGSDSVYAAVALRFGSTLVTRDREQRERLAAVLVVRFPEEMPPEGTP